MSNTETLNVLIKNLKKDIETQKLELLELRTKQAMMIDIITENVLSDIFPYNNKN